MIKLDRDRFIEKTDRVLLAVSGGVDSMVMLELFIRDAGKVDFAVAHCNFSLRGEESDADTEMVERVCRDKGVKLYKIKFDTKSEMVSRKLSMQECARELRYEWFYDLSEKFGFTKIAIAHNLNDSIETFFVNCARGVGVRGLTGIKSVNSLIIRPLLKFSRGEIVAYSTKYEVEYRDDKSNFSDKYLRNDIRHNVIPIFEKRNPQFLKTMSSNLEHINETVGFLDSVINEVAERYCYREEYKFCIELNGLSQNSYAAYLLYEILRRYDFTRTTTDAIFSSFKSLNSGKHFYNISKGFVAVINRGVLELSEVVDFQYAHNFSKFDTKVVCDNFDLTLEVVENSCDLNFKVDSSVAFFDYDKLPNDLILREWQKGDSFMPFGMKGSKMISDLLIDKKLSIEDKKRVRILSTVDGVILWVVGVRADKRFAVTNDTQKVLVCTMLGK